MDALTETNLNAVLDVTDQEAGPHAGMVTFEVSGGLEVVGYTPFNVTVTHKNPGPGTDESTTATSAEVPESQ